MAAAAAAMAVPAMPVKWTDLMGDENIPQIKSRSRRRIKFFASPSGVFAPAAHDVTSYDDCAE
jgi:hypothetical protein